MDRLQFQFLGSSSLTKLVAYCIFAGLAFLSGLGASNINNNLGINYGMVADNLPPPSEVVRLIQSLSVTTTRIYNTNSSVLQAFADTGISFIVGIGNEDVPSLTNPATASTWIQENIANYLPNTLISAIAVGNEVFTGNDTELMNSLLPAMQNLHSALSNLGLDGQVLVSTAHSLAILSNSYPPSQGQFGSAIAGTYLTPLLDFLSNISAPFMINAYPYFAYKASPETISLPYCLFESTTVGVTDASSGLVYFNMLDAQVDAIYQALEALGYSNMDVMVSETGWPSAGDPGEAGATIENAQAYNTNLIKRLASDRGTPQRPDKPLKAYIFALFNEDQKPGASSERNYGLFKPDGTPVYDLGLQHQDVVVSNNSSPMSYATVAVSSSHRSTLNIWSLAGLACFYNPLWLLIL